MLILPLVTLAELNSLRLKRGRGKERAPNGQQEDRVNPRDATFLAHSDRWGCQSRPPSAQSASQPKDRKKGRSGRGLHLERRWLTSTRFSKSAKGGLLFQSVPVGRTNLTGYGAGQGVISRSASPAILESKQGSMLSFGRTRSLFLVSC
jgi:hypothetical protein